MADFLHAQSGLFRVEVASYPPPNIGDLFGIQTTMGTGVTLLQDYDRLRGHTDLFNVRYAVRPASTPDPGAVYQDAAWKVYENRQAFPRAWLVHEVAVERDSEKLFKALSNPSVDLRRTALLSAPLDDNPEPVSEGAMERVDFRQYRANRLDLTVHAQGRALLVLSESFYPGWKATVDGRPTPIWKVEGDLRGIIVPAGISSVTMYYHPVSVIAGAALTVASFASVLTMAAFGRQRGTQAV